MNEKKAIRVLIGIIGVLLFALLFSIVIGIRRVGEYSIRLGEAEQRVDELHRELTEENRRGTELTEEIGSGLAELGASLSSGTAGISARIREAAKRVEVLEDIVNRWRDNSNILNNNGNNSGSE